MSYIKNHNGYTLMQKHVGILLRKYTQTKEKSSIFDAYIGRLEAIIQSPHVHLLHHGTVFSYYPTPKYNNIYLLTEIEIIHTPFHLARENINFLHHLLELCYYFLPLHSEHAAVFELVEKTLSRPIENKLLLLFRFFTLVGFYPENVPFEKSYFLRLLSYPLETILKEKLDDEQLKMLESWLLQCVELHPEKKRFKTIYIDKKI